MPFLSIRYTGSKKTFLVDDGKGATLVLGVVELPTITKKTKINGDQETGRLDGCLLGIQGRCNMLSYLP
jgi:hypothetical protein